MMPEICASLSLASSWSPVSHLLSRSYGRLGLVLINVINTKRSSSSDSFANRMKKTYEAVLDSMNSLFKWLKNGAFFSSHSTSVRNKLL